MKNYAVIFSLFISLFQLHAQVAAEVRFDQDQFLSGESLQASVRISNRSGQSLEFGTDTNWLTFHVESIDGYVVDKLSEVSAPGEFKVDSSVIATRQVDLAPHFATLRPGRYNVQATVRIKDWNSEITSPPKAFNIVRGAQLWTQEFGLPPVEGSTNRTPEMRRYTLVQASYLRAQLRLYFRLTDADDTRVFKVQAIGPMVSFSNLEQQLDRNNSLHALWRTGRQSCTYVAFNTDGEMTAHQTYDLTDTHPKLRLDADGKIIVTGGLRRITPNDIPSESADASTKVENK